MKNPLRFAKLPAFLFLASAAAFSATITVTIIPSIGPGPDGPPADITSYENNAEHAIENNLTTFGGSGPTGYSQVSGSINPLGFIDTPTYFSWLGTVNPASPFDQQHGNAVYFGLSAVSSDPGTTFTINDIAFAFNGCCDNLSPILFNSHNVGYNNSATPITSSGNAATDDAVALTSFYTSGIEVNVVSSNPSDRQGWIDALSGNGQSASYFVGNFSGTVTFDVPDTQLSGTPEPQTFAMMGLGLIGLAGLRRRSRAK